LSNYAKKTISYTNDWRGLLPNPDVKTARCPGSGLPQYGYNLVFSRLIKQYIFPLPPFSIIHKQNPDRINQKK
jgi:hypothetical protein